MKLKKAPIVIVKKKSINKKQKEEKITARTSLPKPFYSRVKEPKIYYNVEIITNNGICQVRLLDVCADNYVITIKGQEDRLQNIIEKTTKGLSKSSYKILKPIEVDFKIELPARKKPVSVVQKPLPTPFIEWYKERLQSLISILDELELGYIVNNLDYKINSYAQQFTITIKVTSGGIVKPGIHRFLFKYVEKEYLYFFNGELDTKGNSIRDLFKENEG
jgi:hypothetical protein